MTQTPARRRRVIRTLRFVPLAVILALIAVAFALALADHWRRGSGTLSLAAAAGAVMRLVLPRAWVGPLAVRSRWLDTVIFAAPAALLAVMTLTPISQG